MQKQKVSGNFQEGIHKADFRDEYLKKPILDSVIADYGREFISLNGDWHFGIDQYDSCLRNKWYKEQKTDGDNRPLPLDYDFDNWDTIPVPSCWNMFNDKLFLYEGSVVYTRMFEYNAAGGERVFIKFGGANYRAFVFLNTEYLGYNEGGSTPFYIEATGKLKSNNRILVVVNNTRIADGVPADNTDWFNYGGLYRDVGLLRMPAAFIRAFSMSLVPDGISAKIRIDGGESGTAVLSVPGLNIKKEIEVKNGSGELVFNARPELWSPDNPRLYDYTVTFGNDTLTDKIGFREIRVSGRDILLNGEPIFLRGVCAHEESVVNGKSVTEAEIRENYALAKEMGCNFMRLAHYPHSEYAARIADEVGIMLWEEIPVYWAIDFDNENTYTNAENQLTALINRDINRASVIIWSVGNENADTDARFEFMSRLADKARAIDPLRLVSAACLADHNKLIITDRLAEKIDIIGINEYYGWYDPDFSKLPVLFNNSNPEKPVIITEFGADTKAGYKGSPDEMYTEEFQRALYEKQLATLREIVYIKGITPWIFFDFRCPRRLNPIQDNYNIKGLLSRDKTYKKAAFYTMRDFYKEGTYAGKT